jgi:hypothetical protein
MKHIIEEEVVQNKRNKNYEKCEEIRKWVMEKIEDLKKELEDDECLLCACYISKWKDKWTHAQFVNVNNSVMTSIDAVLCQTMISKFLNECLVLEE